MYITIQYLRSIAALMVVFTHVAYKVEINTNFEKNLSLFYFGGYGVDLFFIISGFIMCLSVEGKNIKITKFMIDRILRIMPIYWILTTVALVVYILKPELVNSSGGVTSLFSSYTLIPTEGKYLINNAWTLTYEFVFYIIFGSCLALGNINKVGTSILLILMVTLHLIFNFKNPTLLFVTSPILIEFTFGILSYCLIMRLKNNLPIIYSIVIVFTGIVLVFLPLKELSISELLGRSVYAGIPMLFVFIGFVSLEGKIKKIDLFMNLGVSSYSLYLVHPFVLSAITIVFIKLNLLEQVYLYAIAMVVVSSASGWLCYYLIEHKISEKIKNYRRSRECTENLV